jgi:hypothetical protein
VSLISNCSVVLYVLLDSAWPFGLNGRETSIKVWKALYYSWHYSDAMFNLGVINIEKQDPR